MRRAHRARRGRRRLLPRVSGVVVRRRGRNRVRPAGGGRARAAAAVLAARRAAPGLRRGLGVGVHLRVRLDWGVVQPDADSFVTTKVVKSIGPYMYDG